MAADGNTGKKLGAHSLSQDTETEFPSGEPTGKAGTLQPPNTMLQGFQSNRQQDTRGRAKSRIFLISSVCPVTLAKHVQARQNQLVYRGHFGAKAAFPTL